LPAKKRIKNINRFNFDEDYLEEDVEEGLYIAG
jgi:hypothetical protein